MAFLSVYSSSPSEPLYAALGDSISAGYGVPSHCSFVSNYGHWLRSAGIGCCLNGGINGLTSIQLADMLERDKKMEQILRQAIVITVTIGSNDLLRTVPALLQRQQINFLMIIGSLRQNIQRIARRIRAVNPYALVQFAGLYNPLLYTANQQFGQYCRFVQQIIDQVNYTLALTVQGERYEFVAVEAWLNQAAWEGKRVMGKDQIHPGIDGHQALARAFESNYCYSIQRNRQITARR